MTDTEKAQREHVDIDDKASIDDMTKAAAAAQNGRQALSVSTSPRLKADERRSWLLRWRAHRSTSGRVPRGTSTVSRYRELANLPQWRSSAPSAAPTPTGKPYPPLPLTLDTMALS